MFGHHKKHEDMPFDKTGKIPVIRSSICTGEKVAGFKDEANGKFTEIMCIKSEADMQEFLEEYGLKKSDVKREW